jgi:hypothetical protein
MNPTSASIRLHKSMNLLRLFLFAPLLIGTAEGQIPDDYKPNCYITIVAQPYGQSVDVAFLPEDYSREKIQRHLTALQRETGIAPRTPNVHINEISLGDKSKSRIVHLTFFDTKLVDAKQGTIDTQSLARAFAPLGDIDIWLRMNDFTYRGFGTYSYPAKNPTVVMNAKVEVDGVYLQVHLNTTDPARIVIPAVYAEPPKPQPPPAPKGPSLGLMVGVALILSGVAGTLVYYLLRLSVAREAR